MKRNNRFLSRHAFEAILRKTVDCQVPKMLGRAHETLLAMRGARASGVPQLHTVWLMTNRLRDTTAILLNQQSDDKIIIGFSNDPK